MTTSTHTFNFCSYESPSSVSKVLFLGRQKNQLDIFGLAFFLKMGDMMMMKYTETKI